MENTLDNTQVEQGFLGALIVKPDLIDEVPSFKSFWFYYEAHSLIFDTLKKLINLGKDIDARTVISKLNEDNESFEFVGGTESYINNLVQNVITTVNTKTYADIIKDLHVRRGLISVSQNIVDTANNNESGIDADTMIANAEHELYKLTESDKDNEAVNLKDSVRLALKLIEKAKDGFVGLKTGIKAIDVILKGLRCGEVIVIGGRPSMGKTVMGLTIALNIAYDGDPVLFFSMEMPKEQLTQRLLARVSGIDTGRQMDGLDQDEMTEVIDAGIKIQGLPLFIDESAGLSFAEVASRTRRAIRKNGIKCIVIDYLGLMKGNPNIHSKVHQIEEITNGLKALAKEYKIPIVLLHQLSRAVETRDCQRPILSDLRDSGSIEQDADVVMFLYREEYYLERKKAKDMKSLSKKLEAEADHEAKLSQARGKAEIIISKNRMGKVGIKTIKFDGSRQVFRDL